MHVDTKRAFETIDADIFNGDGIAKSLKAAKKYLQRWVKHMPDLVLPERPKAKPCECHGLTPKKHCKEMEKMLEEVPGDFCMHEGDAHPHEAVRRLAAAFTEAENDLEVATKVVKAAQNLLRDRKNPTDPEELMNKLVGALDEYDPAWENAGSVAEAPLAEAPKVEAPSAEEENELLEQEQDKEPSPEQLRQAERMSALAITLGYNELAKMASDLGDKVYYRLARETTMKRFVELGGNDDLFANEPGICTIEVPGTPLRVKFYARDIESMRAAVAQHDEGKEPRGVTPPGTLLRTARVALGLSLREVADRLGIDATLLGEYERGAKSPSDWPTVFSTALDAPRPALTHVACKDTEGVVWSLPKPYRHHNVLAVMRDHDAKNAEEDRGYSQGFLDANGRYLHRHAALVNATENNQIKNGQIIGGVLTSEDLW